MYAVGSEMVAHELCRERRHFIVVEFFAGTFWWNFEVNKFSVTVCG